MATPCKDPRLPPSLVRTLRTSRWANPAQARVADPPQHSATQLGPLQVTHAPAPLTTPQLGRVGGAPDRLAAEAALPRHPHRPLARHLEPRSTAQLPPLSSLSSFPPDGVNS